MSQEMNLSEEERRALEQIDQLEGAGKRGLPDLGELCSKYQSMRPALELLVNILKRIPGIGGKAASAMQFLMSLADVACPIK